MSGGRRGRSPLRERDFALVWVGGLIGDLGDWMLLAALPVHVYGLTGSAAVTATVFLAELIPALLIGPFAGVLVDRWDRRRVLVRAGVVQAVLLLPLLAMTGTDRLWIVYVVAASQSCLARLCAAAKAALVPSLVDGDRLAAANSLNAGGDNLARLIGAPLGGLAIQMIGLPGVVVVDAVTFVLAAAVIAAVRPGRGPTAGAGTTPLFSAWLDGMRVIRRHRPLPATFLIGALAQIAQGIFVVLFVVFVVERLAGGEGNVGLLRGVQAVGGILGGAVLGALAGRIRPRALIGVGFVAFGLISLLTWNAPHASTAVGLYVALFIVAGIPGVAATAGLLTVIQSATPPTHLGRVVAAFEAGAGGLQAVGVLVAGVAADRYGVTAILDVQAGLYVLCGVLALLTLRDAPPPAPVPPALRPAGSSMPRRR